MPVFFSMKAAVIQIDPRWEDKSFNLSQISSLINDSQTDIRIYVLSEMFNTGFSMNASGIAEPMDGDTILWMKKLAEKRNAVICGSLAISEDNRFYNRLLFVKPDGSLCYYDKRHLHTPSGEQDVYQTGNERVMCSFEGFGFSLQICYDLRFPVWSRNRGEADVIIYSSCWPEARLHAWKTLLLARAIENQCYVIGANRVGISPDGTKYSGDSMIIDPIGEIKGALPSYKPGIITFDLDRKEIKRYRKSLPSLKDSDNFNIVI